MPRRRTNKVIERADRSFLGLPNVAVLRPDNSLDRISGLGDTVEEALEDALDNFVKSLGDRIGRAG